MINNRKINVGNKENLKADFQSFPIKIAITSQEIKKINTNMPISEPKKGTIPALEITANIPVVLPSESFVPTIHPSLSPK